MKTTLNTNTKTKTINVGVYVATPITPNLLDGDVVMVMGSEGPCTRQCYFLRSSVTHADINWVSQNYTWRPFGPDDSFELEG